MTTGAGHTPEQTIVIAFDRAFALSRICAAGTNLEQHSEYRTYQKFFELRMPPPTHVQKDDIIIAALAEP